MVLFLRDCVHVKCVCLESREHPNQERNARSFDARLDLAD